MELKTLKDLDLPTGDNEGWWIEGELKKQAIKHIKKFKKDFNLTNEQMPEKVELSYSHLKLKDIKLKSDGVLAYRVSDVGDDNKQRGVSIIAYIMWANNITEEEIK